MLCMDALTHILFSCHALPPLIGNRTLHWRGEGLCMCHSFHLSLSPPLPPFTDHIDRDTDKEAVHVHVCVALHATLLTPVSDSERLH